jgi:hypothetical protein
MVSRFIVGTVPIVPLPESVVEALQTAGHAAAIVEKRDGWAYELAVGPTGNRLLISVSGDLHGARDIDTSSHEFVEEFVPEDEVPSIRRLIDVRCWEHTDPAIVTTVLDYLCNVTSGRIVYVMD